MSSLLDCPDPVNRANKASGGSIRQARAWRPGAELLQRHFCGDVARIIFGVRKLHPEIKSCHKQIARLEVLGQRGHRADHGILGGAVSHRTATQWAVDGVFLQIFEEEHSE
jgi:hypothetical protein